MEFMRLRSVLLVATGLVTAAGYSLHVRAPEDAEPVPTAAATADLDPATGAILIDLDDDISDSERDALEALVVGAIAPYDWPEGDAALGDVLSADAQLLRLHAPASEVADVFAALRANEDVESIERERIWTLPEDALASEFIPLDDDDIEDARGGFRPNDPFYKHQWHLDQIQMPAAWQRSRGQGVVVAVIDTGVSYRDLGSRFRTAPDLKQTRFVAGRDFVENDATPDDEHGHGTHVAGTVAQSTNNGVGVAGVAPQAAIMPIRVLDARGAGSWGSVAAGIRWAADHGADVMNLSLGGGTPSQAIATAIIYAHRKGVVVVVAAGNTGRGRVQYPAANRFAFAVGAVRYDETLSFYSSYGRHLDIVAPGGDLRVDQNRDGMPDGVLQNTILRGNPMRHDYLGFQGTSMAAPHVAGVAALLKASGVRDPTAVERLIQQSAKSKSDRRRYGAGLVQANNALRAGTRDLGAGRGTTAAVFGGLLLLGLRRRRKLGVGIAATLGAAFLTGGGLGVFGFGGSWTAAATGTAGLLSFGGLGVALIAALPLGLVAVFYGAKRGRALLAGTSFGAAGVLLFEAVAPVATSAMWVGPALAVLAGVCLVVGRQVALRSE